MATIGIAVGELRSLREGYPVRCSISRDQRWIFLPRPAKDIVTASCRPTSRCAPAGMRIGWIWASRDHSRLCTENARDPAITRWAHAELRRRLTRRSSRCLCVFAPTRGFSRRNDIFSLSRRPFFFTN